MSESSSFGPNRPRHAGRKRLVMAAPMLLFFLGCFGTANLIPKDANVARSDEVQIDSGRGILFYSVDGHRVSATSVRTLPGRRSLRVDVRRRLRGMDGEALEGIYQVGTCRIRVQADPGDHLEIVARVFAEGRYQVVTDKPEGDEQKLMMGLTVHVLNLGSGKEQRVPPDACELRIDCSKINRMQSKAGKECTF